MKSLQVNYIEAKQIIERKENAIAEPWDEVCKRFDNDVRKVRDVSDQKEYTGMYACYDDDNLPVYYLVEEDKALNKLRKKTFLSKLGRK